MQQRNAMIASAPRHGPMHAGALAGRSDRDLAAGLDHPVEVHNPVALNSG
jgi:hypothetical protein